VEQPGKPVGARHPTRKFIICEAGKPVANRQENSLFVKPESLLLNHKNIHYLWKRPESLLLKGGGDTPQ